tara:strand:- start:235 stop:588 length:354 start_codon:yes stop_codon:yes gene_type:complete
MQCKTGGVFTMMEPNKKYFLEFIRKIWYSKDRYFEFETESPLDHDNILSKNSYRFKLIKIRYYGGPAYFFIYNSLILRVSPKLKRIIAPFLFILENLFNQLNIKFLSPSYIAQWEKI